MAGKAVCRTELLKKFGLAGDFKGPIFGVVVDATVMFQHFE